MPERRPRSYDLRIATTARSSNSVAIQPAAVSQTAFSSASTVARVMSSQSGMGYPHSMFRAIGQSAG
ncbi:MAG: hypothetical protein AB7G35_09605 [Hyphomicrobiaceae bacterium]